MWPTAGRTRQSFDKLRPPTIAAIGIDHQDDPVTISHGERHVVTVPVLGNAERWCNRDDAKQPILENLATVNRRELHERLAGIRRFHVDPPGDRAQQRQEIRTPADKVREKQVAPPDPVAATRDCRRVQLPDSLASRAFSGATAPPHRGRKHANRSLANGSKQREPPLAVVDFDEDNPTGR